MSATFVFYREGVDPYQYYHTVTDQVLGMFNYPYVLVDRSERAFPNSPNIYKQLSDALAAHPGHEWVFFDRNAYVFLDEFRHPRGRTVYAIGSDNVDYDGETGMEVAKRLGCSVLKIRAVQERPYLANAVVAVVAYDRWLKLREWDDSTDH